MLKKLDIFTHFVVFVTLVISFYLYVVPACNVVLMMPYLGLGIFMNIIYIGLLMCVLGLTYVAVWHITPKSLKKYRYSMSAMVCIAPTVYIMYYFDNALGSIVAETPILFSVGVIDSLFAVFIIGGLLIAVEVIGVTLITFKKGGVL